MDPTNETSSNAPEPATHPRSTLAKGMGWFTDPANPYRQRVARRKASMAAHPTDPSKWLSTDDRAEYPVEDITSIDTYCATRLI